MALWDIWPQVLTAFLCNVGVLTFGLQAGWLSPLQPAFQSENSPLGGPPLTDEQISWFGALPSITLTFSAPIFGWLMSKYGRRTALLVATGPNMIVYLILFFANSFALVCVSRILGGFCSCGSFIVGPIYVNEMVEVRLKGILGSITGFFIKLGIIISFISGAYTSYLTMNLISASFTVIFLFLYPWLPESPVYLIGVGKRLEAETVLCKLRRGAGKNLIKDEINNIENLTLSSTKSTSTLKFVKSFAVDKKLRNAMIIVLTIYGFQMLSGYPAIVRYAVDIVSDAGSIFSSYNAAILFAVTQLCCSALGSFLLDKLGRKTLIVGNLIGMALCMSTLSSYIFIRKNHPDNTLIQNLEFIPVATLGLFFGLYGLGFGTVPFVIIAELFGPESRAFASTVLNMWFALVEFFVVKLFPTFSNVLGLQGALVIISLTSFLGSILLAWRMFETKGLTPEKIEEKLLSRRKIVDEESMQMEKNSESLLPLPKTRPHC